MSNIKKLLQGVEVEWKTLGLVCEFQNGFAFKSDLFKGTGLPIVRITNINGKNIDLTDVKYFDPIDYNSGNPLNYSIVKGDILIAMSGATTGKIGYYNLEETAYLNQRVGKFIPNKLVLNSRYLYHFLLTKSNFLYVLAGGGAQPNLSSNILKEKLEIPILPLEIQKEIVRILDKFSTLTAELQAELQARKSQYEYYRNQLLTYPMEESDQPSLRSSRSASSIQNSDNPTQSLFTPNPHTGNSVLQPRSKTVEWKTLGEVGEIGTGNHDTQDAIENGNYIFYARGREPLRLNVFDFDEIAIITAGDGVGVGKVFHYAHGKYALHQRAYRIVPGKRMNPRFVYHYISANFYAYVQKTSVSSSVTSLRRPMLLKFPIPIPYPNDIEKSLKEQERIASILDKFDTLTTSITEGLPKEIELRQKQYEYYRDMLLTFPTDNIKA